MMGNMALLTLCRAWHLTGKEAFLETARALLVKSLSHAGRLRSLKGVTQGIYYTPVALPFLEGAIAPRGGGERFDVVEPVSNWRDRCRQRLGDSPNRGPTLFLGDELAAACAPPERRGRAPKLAVGGGPPG